MSKIPSIVEGEASESDSEDGVWEHKIVGGKKLDSDIPHGVIVAGEAPESDDETSEPRSNENTKKEPHIMLNTSFQPTPSNVNRKDGSDECDSLLQKKLSECNISLRNNIANLLKTTVQNSFEQLTEAEKLLVNSQMRVQRVSGSIKTFSSNSSLLTSKLVQSSSYLPHIHIPDEDV